VALEDQRNAHGRTHEEQINMREELRAEHEETRAQIRKAGMTPLLQIWYTYWATVEELSIIRGVITAPMASGNIHRRCMQGTRQSILEEVEKWRLDPMNPRILWLADVTGSGKSTLAKEMAERWKEQGCLAGRFFFSRDAEETRNPKFLFTTIAQQGLAHLGPDVRAAVASGISKLIDPVSATLEEQCTNIFVIPLKRVQVSVILVLDALDECDQQACQQLLRTVLPHLSDLPHLKLFMTSRPENHIRGQLSSFIYRELSFRSDKLANSKDVEFYMTHRLDDSWLTDIQTKKLIEQAGGLFIWARTVCDLVKNFRGDRLSFIARVLSQKVQEMDNIYRVALEQIIGTNKAKETVEAYMKVLSIIVAAYEPVTPYTIDKLLKISDSMEIVKDLRSVFECSGPDDVIRFLHPTFREFLLTENSYGYYQVDIDATHKLMASGCLHFMQEELKYDTCTLFGCKDRSFKPEELDDKCLQNTSVELRYSCNFWGHHLILRKNSIPSSLTSIVENFFKYKLLDWIYMVAVQGSIDKAITMLRNLIAVDSVSSFCLLHRVILSHMQLSNIGKWSKDASRFLKLHWNILRRNPLRVYHEFVLAPKSSIFYQIYSKMESFPHPTVLLGLESDWPSRVKIQTYHVQTHQLTPSGDLFITGGEREDLAVYSVWNISAGEGETFVHPCRSSWCSVTHIAFHQYGPNLELQTGCMCGKLCRWNLLHGIPSLLEEKQLAIEKGYRQWASDGSKALSQVFIKNGTRTTRLSVFSTPSTHFDLCEGTIFEKWEFSPGHGDKVLRHCAGMLKVWECSTGHQLFQKECSMRPPAHFSPDGTLIVYSDLGVLELISSEDGTVRRRWNEVGLVSSTQFFPEGEKIIAIGPRFIHLLNGDTRHKREVDCTAISISPNGQNLALIGSKAIRIFNDTLEEELEYHEHQTDFRADCRISWTHSIRIALKDDTISFEKLSANPRLTFSNHNLSVVEKLLLSPDNDHLLTIHKDQSVHLWDLRSGHEVQVGNIVFRSFPHMVSMEYALDSSWVILWNHIQLLALRISASIPTSIISHTYSPPAPSFPSLTSHILIATFLYDPKRILIIHSDGKLVILSLQDMSQSLMPPLRSSVKEIRHLAISPTQDSVAICSNLGLILKKIHEDTHQVLLLSSTLYSAGFSADESYLYILEAKRDKFMISRVNATGSIFQRLLTGNTAPYFAHMPRSVKVVTQGEWSGLKFSSSGSDDILIDLSSDKPVAPPSCYMSEDSLKYMDYWILTLPRVGMQEFSLTQDRLAFIDQKRAVVLDYSCLVTEM
jgi:WD40 repeat protein